MIRRPPSYTLFPYTRLVRAHGGGIDLAATDDTTLAVGAGLEPAALAHLHGEMNDRVVLGLPVNLGEHYVGPGLGEEASAFHRRSEEHTSELQSRQYLVCRLL